jgi:hypothetical protein
MIPRIVLRQRFYLTLLQRLQHSVVTNLDDARGCGRCGGIRLGRATQRMTVN